MKTYSEKLKDPRWQRKRLEIMQRDNFSCYDCGADDETLAVHHLYYVSRRMPWEYPSWSLRTLCASCHERYHGNPSALENFETIMELFTDDGSGGDMAEYYAHDVALEFSRLANICCRHEAAQETVNFLSTRAKDGK